MADLTARFSMVDDISDNLSRMAETGQSMLNQWSQAGDTANAAFDNLAETAATTATTANNIAASISNLQEVSNGASSSADSLSDTLNNYDAAAGEMAEQSERTAEALEEQDRMLEHCERSADSLSDAIETAGDTHAELSEAMEAAGETARELADNENVSAEAREALAEASTEAAEAMEELERAQAEAQAAMGNYDAVIASGTTNLEELGDAAEQAAQAAENLEEANNRASEATEELARATEDAADEAEEGGSRGQDAAEELSNALAAAGIAVMVKETADAFMDASEAAAEFETATMKISTIADTAQVPLATISSDLMKLSRDTGESVNELSEAAYSALSASVDTASAVDFTGRATQLAVGGFTSSATAVDVLTTSLNAYGLEASEAGGISDMLITTQNLGKTTVDELAASVGKVIPIASAYGVEMDNLSASYAELTKGGIATAEAGTYLKAMLNELGDGGSKVSKVLIEQTGNSFAQLTEQGQSIGDVMGILGDSVNGNAGAFNELWSSSEAGVGALSLYNAGAEQFNSTLDAMQNSVGATSDAYAAMTDTTAHAQEELANAADNLQISIGQSINPMVESLYGLGTGLLNSITDFTQEHPIAVKAISAMAVGLGVVATAMTAYTVATTAAIPALVSFGTALNAALGPIGWVALAITGVVTAGIAFASMMSDVDDETAGMTAVTRGQYYELQNLNAEYEEACAKYGKTSEEANRLKYQVDGLSDAFESNRQTLEAFAEEVDSLCGKASQVTDDFNTALTEIGSQETGSLAIIQRYEDLATQANLTGSQEKELEAITKKLSEDYPDLSEQLDSAALSAEEYSAAMKAACEQEAEEQRQQQAQDTYVEALAKRAELTEELEKAQANYNAELESHNMTYNETLGQYTNGIYTEDSPFASWMTDLDEYQDALDKLNAANDENEATIARIEEGWENISETEEEAADSGMAWEEAVSTAYEGVRSNIEGLCAAYDEAYNAALESFGGQFGLFDEASTKSEEYMSSTVANAQKAVESQLAYWESYSADVETLKSKSAADLGITQSNYEALMSYAQDGSEQAAGLAHSMAEAIKSGDENAVAALANTLGKVTAKQDEIARATADWQTDFTEKMNKYASDMEAAIKRMDLSAEAKTSANSTINGYINSIKAGKASAVAAAQDIANSVAAALKSANTSVNVNVNKSNSTATTAPAHANGTTNAENMFIAGEAGPELIVSKAAAYAGGTTDSDGFYIAGENGPELIVGRQGSTVFPTEETDRIINSLNNKEREPLDIKAGGLDNGKGDTGEQTRRILLEIAGSGAIEVGGRGGADKESILEVLTEHIKPVLLGILQQEIYEEGDLSYEF